MLAGLGAGRGQAGADVGRAWLQGGYQVLLDHRLLKTPAKRPLTLPSRALALAVAAEWEQQARRIQPFTMPLMSLAATAIDQPKPREEVVDMMLEYLHTDSVLCRENRSSKLGGRQAEVGLRVSLPRGLGPYELEAWSQRLCPGVLL